MGNDQAADAGVKYAYGGPAGGATHGGVSSGRRRGAVRINSVNGG